jgi:hypothetical protein
MGEFCLEHEQEHERGSLPDALRARVVEVRTERVDEDAFRPSLDLRR